MKDHAPNCEKGRCFTCKKRGHKKDTCYQNKDRDDRRSDRRHRSRSRDRRDRRDRHDKRDRKDHRHGGGKRNGDKDSEKGTPKKAKVLNAEVDSGSGSESDCSN